MAPDPQSAIDRWLRQPRLAEDRQRYLLPMLEIGAAHVVMLREQGLLAPADAAAGLAAIEAVRRDPARLDAFPDREDLYQTVEAALVAEAGEASGGRLHLGRSRNDLTATMTRLVLRQVAEEIEEALLALVGDLVRLAGVHLQTVMPGYTHQRPAQPTTLAHYLSGVAEALRRDADRLAAARERADECPLGAAAFAGTSFPIDRARVAALLGFGRPVPHSLDAVASRDAVLELLAALALTASTVARLLQDLYLWSTEEYGFLAFAPAITGGSSIMPQKRNPNVLERTRAKTAHVTAAFVDAVMAEKGTGFMHCQDVSVDSVAPIWRAAPEMVAMLEVSREILAAAEVDAARLRERSTAGFTLATDVADALVRSRDLPFRTAHRIVQRAAQEGADGSDPAALAGTLNAAAHAILRRSPQLTAAEVAEWLDPLRSVTAKRSAGSPAPPEVQRLLDGLHTWHEAALQRLAGPRVRRERARAALAGAVQAILEEGRER